MRREKESIFPPNFAQSMNREVIGVISKVDTGRDLETPRKNLKLAGAGKFFEVSIHDPESIAVLRRLHSHEE